MGSFRKLLVVNRAATARLRSIAQSPGVSHSLARRARIVLMSAEGASNQTIAAHCGVSVPTVNLWRQRWREDGIPGLQGKPRPGRPPAYNDEDALALMQRVLQSNPGNTSRWTVRAVAAQTGLSKSTVARYLAKFRLKPHLNSAKTSSDSRTVQSVCALVGLYMYPPDKTFMLCINETARIPARGAHPVQPPAPLDCVKGVAKSSHDTSTTGLLAALKVFDRPLLRPKHRSRDHEVLAFLDRLDRTVPEQFDLRLIAENDTREHLKLKAWLAARPRYRLHWAPTHSMWLDLLGSWLSRVTPPNSQRRWTRNLRSPIRKIDAYIEQCNTRHQPFGWIATANSIH